MVLKARAPEESDGERELAANEGWEVGKGKEPFWKLIREQTSIRGHGREPDR
eukprot:CAMPEP_0177449854 /NCGR_PEP_ID=MMETSP0369-20130122/8938_1 /TAXON_ID=447022 ORGANISM="Scrippsiella hangoei-like, Strain SHHI-4" /NCGR_SAMPLE_ID=MMETSP0369 /ASSEMBLY_ACC=CAM_ASM_000364 /LENGTH=51 /DNA_ID=CAMNT_0018922371 /DNA_START=577 /DNA_END=729 /DNA_ORIENTATION=+